MREKFRLLERIEAFTNDVHRIIDDYHAPKPTTSAILDQLARSSLSCALNYSEAISAESRKDFIHKLRIVLKELRETTTSLRLLRMKKEGGLTLPLGPCIAECNELIAIIYSSIRTTESNSKESQTKK